jgi:hypothetical protein
MLLASSNSKFPPLWHKCLGGGCMYWEWGGCDCCLALKLLTLEFVLFWASSESKD